MIINNTYKKPHSSFKLNGVFYDNSSLLSLARVYVERSDDYLFSLGIYNKKWVDPNSKISLQTS
ncbi:MAG: hypothetical protein P8O09_02345, partial [Flavobacteriaceae bacterium]|nr:hypothetical protein [Flavobacteriaceae bacterium]